MKQEVKEIRIGLPKGSLNTPGRGNTYAVLTSAGYDVRGYEPGKESDRNLFVVNDSEIIPRLIRPQSVPIELRMGLLDIAITGEDWIKEETISNPQGGIQKIGDLGYGQTRLVIAVPDSSNAQSLSDFFMSLKGRAEGILCFTEYINLTRQRFMQNAGYQMIFGNQIPFVEVRGLRDGENKFVKILNSDGITEGYIAKGADIIADNTQSGSTLRAYGLRELETIFESSVGFFAGPNCRGWKERKAQEIFERLKGGEKNE